MAGGAWAWFLLCCCCGSWTQQRQIFAAATTDANDRRLLEHSSFRIASLLSVLLFFSIWALWIMVLTWLDFAFLLHWPTGCLTISFLNTHTHTHTHPTPYFFDRGFNGHHLFLLSSVGSSLMWFWQIWMFLSNFLRPPNLRLVSAYSINLRWLLHVVDGPLVQGAELNSRGILCIFVVISSLLV
jgi:hypothetical protein